MFQQLLRLASRSASASAPTCEKPTENSNLKKDDPMASTRSGPTLLLPSQPASWPSVAHLPETKQLVAQQAISRLFTERHFSICALDEVIKLTGAQRDSEAYRLLHTLHCVNWSDMDPALRDRVPLLVREALLTNQWARDAAATAMSALEPTA